MDEQTTTQHKSAGREMTDGEILAAAKKRLDKLKDYFESNHIPLLWRSIFTFVLIANLIYLFFFLTILSWTFFPTTVGFYLLLFIGYILNISLIIFVSTILSLTLFIFIQKPQGKTLDLFIRLIYSTVTLYLIPLVFYFFGYFFR